MIFAALADTNLVAGASFNSFKKLSIWAAVARADYGREPKGVHTFSTYKWLTYNTVLEVDPAVLLQDPKQDYLILL